MHSVVDLPGDTLEQWAQHNDDEGVTDDKVHHCEKVMAEFEHVIVGHHGPPCFHQHLHEDELRAQKCVEVRVLVVCAVWRLVMIDNILFPEYLHAHDSQHIVGDHVEWEELQHNGNDNGHLTD